MRQIVYALLTRAPVVIKVQALYVTPRLACVRPAASVHPEPGSNSSSLNFKYYLATKEIIILFTQNGLFSVILNQLDLVIRCQSIF